VYKYRVLDRSGVLARILVVNIHCDDSLLSCAPVVREIPIPTPHADERLLLTTLKPCEEINNGRVITLTRTVVEAGRDDCRVSKAA
jgi:hypothetical protein